MTERPDVYCPGCGKAAPQGTYPEDYQGPWWCNDCLLNKIKEARCGKR